MIAETTRRHKFMEVSIHSLIRLFEQMYCRKFNYFVWNQSLAWMHANVGGLYRMIDTSDCQHQPHLTLLLRLPYPRAHALHHTNKINKHSLRSTTTEQHNNNIWIHNIGTKNIEQLADNENENNFVEKQTFKLTNSTTNSYKPFWVFKTIHQQTTKQANEWWFSWRRNIQKQKNCIQSWCSVSFVSFRMYEPTISVARYKNWREIQNNTSPLARETYCIHRLCVRK